MARGLSTALLHGAWVLVISGCSYSQLEADKVDWTPAGSHHIGVTQSRVETLDAHLEAHSVTFHGAWQIEEYTRLLGDEFDAELYLAFTPLHKTVSLDYSLSLEDFVESWSFNHQRPKVWLPAGRFYWRPAHFFYRRYRLLDVNRECVGYTANWRPKADDPRFRPSRLSFGYFCLNPGVPLSAEDAKLLLRRIEIRLPLESGEKSKSKAHPPPTIGLDCLQGKSFGRNSALDLAQGAVPCSGAGNPRFPFKFAIYYNLGHGKYSR